MALLLEYRGTAYRGFQLQPGLPTVQGELERALEELTGERPRVTAAGRTDAGVHALGQVVSFRVGRELPTPAFVSGLNRFLPSDIAVRAARMVDEEFDARRKALRREYAYRILVAETRSALLDDRTWWLKGSLDVEAMDKAAGSLVGRRNFKNLAGPIGRRSPVRTMYRAGVTLQGASPVFRFEADSFLPQQVRRMVGALVAVGQGRLGAGAWESPFAGATDLVAPACGLYLRKVTYGDELFSEVDQDLYA